MRPEETLKGWTTSCRPIRSQSVAPFRKKASRHFRVGVAFSPTGSLLFLQNNWWIVWETCSTRRRRKFAGCQVGVVYRKPFCCRCYIEQMGRRLNDRLGNIFIRCAKLAPFGHRFVHCDRCGWTVTWDQVNVEARHKTKSARKLHEPFLITKERDAFFSAPSSARHSIVSISTRHFSIGAFYSYCL